MTFLWIDILWLLALVPLLVLVYIFIQRRKRKYALRYASLSLVKEALGHGPGVRRHIPPILFLIGATTMIFALARPVATVILPSQESKVILTIDVSRSMMADDLKPNRLEAAKSAARLFVEKQPAAVNIGVVSFSANAAVVQAPTRDHEAVLAAINRLTPQFRTAIGSAILTSLDAIFEEPGAKSNPAPLRDPLMLPEPKPALPPVPRGTYAPAIIVLLTDGQSNTGPLPMDVVDQAINRGVRVYTIGVGSPAGTILNFGEYSVRVRLDEETLKRIAVRTDAKYYLASSETLLNTIYENLGTALVFKPEETELTAAFTAAAVAFVIIAGALSMLWLNRLP
jgi:Ca-activated chloride channel family protein